MADDPTPPKPFLRSGIVTEAVSATVQGMGEMGMSPPEALIAAELVLWTFIENGMKGSPTPDILLKTKEQAARVVARIASRIEAWPAKTHERN
jgi:hypothetical protein